MGREVRMVPANWEHPRNGDTFIPLLGGRYADEAATWDAEAAKWSEGFKSDYRGGWRPRDADDTGSYAEWAGERPDEANYMPDWPEAERTHLMMYESTSEGTPISPAFATPEELARWLTDNKASAFGSSTATYEQWLSAAKRGWSPSAVIENGVMMSGVEALATGDA